MNRRAAVCVAAVALLATACASSSRNEPTAQPSDASSGGGPGALPTLAPDAKLTWKPAGAMPTPRTEVAVASLAGLLYVAGGFTADGKASAVVEAFHPGRNEWTSVPSLPTPLHHAGMAASGGVLYVIGGFTEDGKATDAVWKMPPGGQVWEPAAKLPTARGAFGVAVVEGRIHAVGGATAFNGGKDTGDHAIYDVSSAAWSKAASLPDPRDHLAAAAVGPSLVVLGGRKLTADRNSARVDIYDDDARRWRRGTDMPTARSGLGASEWQGRVFAAGGEDASKTYAQVEWLEVGTGRWHTAPALPAARHGLGVIGFDFGPLVIVGGGPRPGLSVTGQTDLLVAG